MIDKPKKISDTARALLTAAAMRDDHQIRPPKLPIAAARQVVRSLLNAGLAEEVLTSIGSPDFVWLTRDAGEALVLRATAQGLERVADGRGSEAASGAVDTVAETAAVLTQTGSDASNKAPAAAPSEGQSVSGSTYRPAKDAQSGPDGTNGRGMRTPRHTKQARVLAMLRRNEGASGPAIAEAMGWASHTVRSFLAGLAKKGIMVKVLERVGQVGPDKQGAKGSYTAR
jgi:hypothetical protein